MGSDRRRLILWVSAVLMVLCLFGNGGFRSLIRGWSQKRDLSKSLVQLRADHESLANELNRLQQDPTYTEYLIRRDLKYVKKGEVEYRVLKPRSENP